MHTRIHTHMHTYNTHRHYVLRVIVHMCRLLRVAQHSCYYNIIIIDMFSISSKTEPYHVIRMCLAFVFASSRTSHRSYYAWSGVAMTAQNSSSDKSHSPAFHPQGHYSPHCHDDKQRRRCPHHSADTPSLIGASKGPRIGVTSVIACRSP